MAQAQQPQNPPTVAVPEYASPQTAQGRPLWAPKQPREQLWPKQGAGRHLIVVTVLLGIVAGVYSNSYQSGMTLDNKYIIDEYYKAVMRINPKLDLEGREQVAQLFKYDYWWPKGISGLYRPITSFTYWIDYVFLSGKQVKTDWDGRPIDNRGRLVDGQGRLIDKKGNLLDQQGRLIDPQGRLIDRETGIATAQGDVAPPYDPKKLTWAEYTAAPGQVNCDSYHTINLVLHWVNAVLIYFVSLVVLQRVWPAAFVAALFAAHPIATETVTNIIGRADMFAALTVFGGLLLYMRSTTSRGAWRPPWLIGLMLVCAFGFFSKESAIAVGLVIPLYWLTFRFGWEKLGIGKVAIAAVVIAQIAFALFSEMVAGAVAGGAIVVLVVLWITLGINWDDPKSWPLMKRLLIETFCVWTLMLPPLAAMAGVRQWVFRNSSPAETPFLDNPIRGIWQVKELSIPAFEEQLQAKPMRGLTRVECKITAVKIMGRLLLLLAWPWTLSSDYSFAEIPNFAFNWKFWQMRWDDWQAVIAVAALLAIAAVAVRLWRRGNRAALFFIAFFFLAALPTSNFIVTIGSVMAERFMYLPLAGFTGVVAIFVFTVAQKFWKWLQLEDPDDFPWHRLLAGAALSLVVIVFGIRAYFRNYVWHDDQSLWEDAIVHSTRSFRCYQSLAFALYEKLEFNLPDEPAQRDAERMKRIERMISTAEGALPIVDILPHHLNSSRFYLHLGMYYSLKAEALSRRMPDGSLANTAEGNAFYQKAVDILERGSKIDRAFNEVNKAKQRQRNDPPEEITDAGLGPVYGTLGLAYARLGDYDSAFRRLQYQRQLDPTDIDAYLKIATVHLAAGRAEQACPTLLQCMLMDGTRQQVWMTLAQIFQSYGERGRGALVMENNQLRLNIQHDLVRYMLLQAYRDFIKTFRQSHRFYMAEERGRTAIETYHFPPESIDPLFEGPIHIVTPDGVQYDLEETALRGYRPPTTGPTTRAATGPSK